LDIKFLTQRTERSCPQNPNDYFDAESFNRRRRFLAGTNGPCAHVHFANAFDFDLRLRLRLPPKAANMNTNYQPRPVDTSSVTIPEALQEKIEDLARNNHEVWASSRISEGWRYGPGLDREKREHPSLVPYKLLPESEKDVDRATVVQTLKATLAMGFRIEHG